MSLRTKFLLIVLAGAVAPLALIGLWLTRTAARSGEELLRNRLTVALDRGVQEIGARWVRHRAELLSLAERQPATGRRGAAETPPVANYAVFRDSAGAARWTLGRPTEAATPVVTVVLEVYDPASGRRRGTLEAQLAASALVGGEGAAAGLVGAVLAVFERSSGASLLALPFDPTLLTRDRFQWGGDDWLALRRTLSEPALELVTAAPLTPFTRPFEEAARSGTLVLVAVALTCILLAALLTGRMTRSLATLAAAADAVARGDLQRQVEDSAGDEVGRVARAFNAMTESLRRTLAELARRESLAAVGQFAATLAHEVRNPLTAIRLDLQRVEESLPADTSTRKLQERALAEIERLDRAVTGALRLARSGQVELGPIDLRPPLEAAAAAALPEFAARGATLAPLPLEPVALPVRGDPGALEQLFLNLLLNAAQALDGGGVAAVDLQLESAHQLVKVRDNGCGIAADQLERIFEPFFSSKSAGTGLGLTIARQIVLAHGGEIGVESVRGQGTTVSVRLPRDLGTPGARA